MAIDKKLIFWKKQSTFNAPSNPTDTTGSVLWYSIVFFKDTGKIWTNGTFYNCTDDWESITNKPSTFTPSEHNHDGLMPLVIGTQAAATEAWTGIASTIDTLYDGLTINYWLPYSGSGNATLNLTLKGGGTTGAINCYYSGASRLTTHYAAGNAIKLTYRVNASVNGTAYTGWWANANYDTSDNYTHRRYGIYKIGPVSIAANTIVAYNSNGLIVNALTTPFQLNGSILWCGTAYSANATGSNANMYEAHYSVSISGTGFTGLTLYKPLYLKGTVSGDTFTPIGLTQTEPTTEDNYVYIMIGVPQSTTNTIQFYFKNFLYIYKDGSMRLYGGYSESTGKLANSVNITVGDSTKSFDGASALAFTLAEIGASPLNHNHDNTYLGKTAQAVDSDKLDGLDSTRFMYYNNTTGEVLDADALGTTRRIYLTTSGGTNFPVATSNAGILHQHTAYDTSYGYQTFYQTSVDKLYLRKKALGVWGSWRTILDGNNTFWGTTSGDSQPLTIDGTLKTLSLSSHTHNYLPLTGGTLSGSITIDRGATSAYLINMKASNVTTSMGSLNGDWFHFTTDSVSGFYFYKNVQSAVSMTAPSFIKTGSSNSYVLLGAGGHKLISDFTAALVTSTTTNGTSNVVTGNTNTYLNVVQGGVSSGSSTQITGDSGVTVASDTNGKLTISGPGVHTGLYSSRANGLGSSSNSVLVTDTRSTNPLPSTELQRGVWFDFKQTSAIGLTGATTYAGTITMVPYQDNSGNSNAAFRLAQSGNNLYFQNWNSSWGTWNKIWDSQNLTKLSQLTNDSGFITSSSNITGNAATATKLSNIQTTFTGTYPLTVNVGGIIYSHEGITYTGSTNTLTTSNFVGNLTGTASNSDKLNGQFYYNYLNRDALVHGNILLTMEGVWTDLMPTGAPEAMGLSITGSRNYTSDFIEVQSGETLYWDIWAMQTGATTTAYTGIERYDKDKKPIAVNSGCYYAGLVNTSIPSTWTKFSGSHTLPLTHTIYNGSDGAEVRYIKFRFLGNYSGSGQTYYSGFRLYRDVNIKKSKVEEVLTGNITTHTHSYLPLSGGSISGTVYNMLTLSRTTANGSSILFQNSSGNLGKLGFDGSGNLIIGKGTTTDGAADLLKITPAGVTTFYNSVTASSFIKSGGTSSQFLKADGTVDSNAYLPLSGGILTGYLEINTPNTGGSSFLRFKRNGVNVGYVGDGASGANTEIELSNYISGKSLSLGNDGILRYGGNAVWHQGNDGTGSGLDADLLDGLHAKYNGGGNEAWGYIPVVAADGTMQVGRYLDFNHSSGIGVDYNARLHTNGVTDGELYINSNRIWHAGNFNPSNYLPLTGGTLTNPSYGGQLTIDRSLAGGSAIILYKNSVDGWTKAMGVDHLGRPVFEGSVMWHAGNLNLSTYFTYRGSFTSSSNANNMTDMGMWLNTTGNGTGNSNFPAQYGYIQTFSRGVENYSRWQMSVDNTADNIHIRAEWAGVWGGWKKLWHSANDGSGSGLDADLLDGINGDSFLRNDMGILSSASQLIPNGLQYMSTGSHDLGGDLPSTIEGTIANFNGFSKSSNALGFKLLVPASVGTGLYYQSFYNSYRGWTKVYDTKNSNLTTIDWAAKNLSVANNIVFTSGASSNLISGVTTLSLGAGGVNGVLNITSDNVATFKELLLADGARIYSAAGAGLGISLFNEPSFNPNYGFMFAQTVYKGAHGVVNGDWATYFTMSPDAGRGWIFTNNASSSSGNVASISNTGNMSLNGYLQVQGGSSVPGIKSSYYGNIGMYFGDKLQYQSTSGIKEFIMTTRLYNINPANPSYSQYNRVPVILWHGRVTITASAVSFLMYNSGGIYLTGSRVSTGTATITMNAQSGALVPTAYTEYMVVATGLGTANTTGSAAFVTIPDTYKYSNNFRMVIADDNTANDGYAEIMIIKVMDPAYYTS